jgi:hypothetical protein
MVELARIKASEPAGEITAALIEDGAVIVEGLLDADLLDRFNRELDPLLAAADPTHGGHFVNDTIAWFFGAHTRHVTGVTAKSPIFATEIMTHPVYRAVADAVLLPNCARYQLNLAHVLDPDRSGSISIATSWCGSTCRNPTPISSWRR